jgi:3-mercaptopyruvate sulfurtransferase SseA
MIYKLMKNSSMEKRLALLALLLGVFAAVVGNPYQTSINTSKMIQEIELKSEMVHLVEVRELAEWIMTKKNDFILVDVRLKTQFEDYHIPYAKNVLYDSLANDRFDVEKKVVFYWQNEKFPYLAWFSLKDFSEKEVFILKGGLNECGGRPRLKNKIKKKSSRQYLREGC